MAETEYTYLQCEFCWYKWKVPYSADNDFKCPECGDVGLKKIILQSTEDPEWFNN
jgi:PHP family Zn ribbon phosphoesterase